MPTFPAFKTKPYYDALKTWLTTSLNEDGTLKDSAVQEKVAAALAAEPNVVAAAESAAAAAVDDAVTTDPDIGVLKTGSAGDYLTVGSGGKVWHAAPIIDATHPRWGLVADGVTDNRAAMNTLTAYVAALGGGVVQLGVGAYVFRATLGGTLGIPAGVEVRGLGMDATEIVFTSDGGTTDWRNGVASAGDNATLSHLTLRRGANIPISLIFVGAHRNFTVRSVRLDGARDAYSTVDCHGILIGEVPAPAETRDMKVEGCEFTRLVYSLLQNNASTAIIHSVTVRDCTFADNDLTDLEFNSPIGTTTNITVENTTHRDNNSTGYAGFAVGLANVKGARLRNITAENYQASALHIEDYTENVLVDACHFTDCGRIMNVIDIIGRSSDITIRDTTIENDMAVTAGLYGISTQDLSTGTTVGGRPVLPPVRVKITGNTIRTSQPNRGGIYALGCDGLVVHDNDVSGPGVADAPATENYTGGDLGYYGMSIASSPAAKVTANRVRGYWTGIGRVTDDQFGGRGMAVEGNTVSDCFHGIVTYNPGAGVVSGNVITKSVFPLIVGMGIVTVASEPVVVFGNHAYACSSRVQVDGAQLIFNYVAATVGTGITLNVIPGRLAAPIGTVIDFGSGRTFTLTANYPANSYTMVGDLAGGDLPAWETGTMTIPHSMTAADNVRLVFGNGDHKHGAAGYPYQTIVNGDWTP